jgi:hypothetical protein
MADERAIQVEHGTVGDCGPVGERGPRGERGIPGEPPAWWMERVGERLARMEEGINQIKRCLFGNGQPGRCTREAGRMDELGDRIRALETHVTYQRGVAAVIGAISGAVILIVVSILKLFIHG